MSSCPSFRRKYKHEGGDGVADEEGAGDIEELEGLVDDEHQKDRPTIRNRVDERRAGIGLQDYVERQLSCWKVPYIYQEYKCCGKDD